MAKARSGSTVKKGLKFFLYGKEGSRKSSFALDFMKMYNEAGRPLRVFYLDTEFGSIDNYLGELEAEGVDLANLFIVYGNTYEEAEEWLGKAISDEDIYYDDEDGEEVLALDADGEPFRADAIIVDSITPILDTVKYGMIKTSEKRARLKTKKKEGTNATDVFVAEATAGMEFKDYDKLQAKGKNLLRSLITRTNKYVCVIAREKDKKEQVKDGSNFKSVKIGVMPDAPKDAAYEFFTVIHMIEDEETLDITGQIERKDRTLTFQRGEIMENPSPILWQSVITGNKGKKEVQTNNKDYEEIVVDQAKAMYGGRAPDEKSKKSNTKEDTPVDEKSLAETFENIRSGLSPSKKQGLSAQLSKAKLPKITKNIVDIEVLTKMVEVANKM